MDKLKQALEGIKGENVNIYMQHKLFGDDSLKCDKFVPVIENCIGFQWGDQVVHIKYNNINSYEIKNNQIIINGNNRSIKIVKK